MIRTEGRQRELPAFWLVSVLGGIRDDAGFAGILEGQTCRLGAGRATMGMLATPQQVTSLDQFHPTLYQSREKRML